MKMYRGNKPATDDDYDELGELEHYMAETNRQANVGQTYR